jgi:hypothetical protein
VNVHVLIESIVRQTTVLIAQLATSGGVRAPLSRIAGQVFLSLAQELETQGISRKVGADMFGMALRTYQRKTQRVRESATDRGRTLWEAVLGFVAERPLVTRAEVLERFHRDDEALVRGVLHDLSESGLVFATGNGARTAYRTASEEELGSLRRLGEGTELEGLLWATIYRQGPIARDALLAHAGSSGEALNAALDRLVETQRVRVEHEAGGVWYSASEIVLGFEQPSGWEGAVLDHFHAVVSTICAKLALEPTAHANDVTGGSTYTFVVWPGHPLFAEVTGHLQAFRRAQSELRKRVDAFNRDQEVPEQHVKVIAYAGQCVVENEGTPAEETNHA